MADGDFDQRVPAAAADEVGELARSFNVMAANIADLERQHRELIANVSHELRTPIAALRGNLENLQDGVVDDPDATIDAMLRQTERLGYLVNQVLDLSRLEAGASALRFVQMDLVAVIGDAVGEARLQIPQQKIVVEAPPDLPIEGDPERLHQVISNLLSNAGRYSPEGKPIRVAVRAAGSQVLMVVEDFGPGIPPKELDRVFDRYHRADDQVARSRGFGLGLAISKWIVDMHSGTITASNGPDAGCVMTVELPADWNQPPAQGS
jgi:signal transduction histidine kinase